MMRHTLDNALARTTRRRVALLLVLLCWASLALVGCSLGQPSSRQTPAPATLASISPAIAARPTDTPREVGPPELRLDPLPAAVSAEDGLTVRANAHGEAQIVSMTLLLNGITVYETAEGLLLHNLDTRSLAPGRHILAIEARDAADRVGRQETYFEVLAASSPTPRPPMPTASATPTVRPSATPTAWPSPSPTATTAPTFAPTSVPAPVQVSVREITIDTYAYEQALYTDPAAGHPYPLLRHGEVGDPRPQAYELLVLRNEYLELAFLPGLGGRLYQCTFLPTGQQLFYNNAVIKPTHWGPEDQGWWLAVGGMEFCLPVDEHGYVTAQPWESTLFRHDDGGVSVRMSILEQSRNLQARVTIRLNPRSAAFTVHSEIRNLEEQPKRFQYWINAMFAPGGRSVGPGLRFYYPTSEVIVHSRGDGALPDAGQRMSWPLHDGRDMSLYGNWRNWLGFFAPLLDHPYTAVYDEQAQVGLLRAFPQVAQGNKLFGFGSDFGAGAYTDDESKYVEMWGGLTPTFWDYATLGPQERVAWEETWYVLARSGGPTIANGEASLSVTRAADGWELTVYAPGEQRWTLRVERGASNILVQPFAVRPDAPFRQHIVAEGGTIQEMRVSIIDATGRQVLAYDMSLQGARP
jgi:hypothetical protein